MQLHTFSKMVPLIKAPFNILKAVLSYLNMEVAQSYEKWDEGVSGILKGQEAHKMRCVFCLYNAMETNIAHNISWICLGSSVELMVFALMVIPLGTRKLHMTYHSIIKSRGEQDGILLSLML